MPDLFPRSEQSAGMRLYNVLGKPVAFGSDSKTMNELMSESFRCYDEAGDGWNTNLQIRILTDFNLPRTPRLHPIEYSVDKERLTARSPDVRFSADRTTGIAEGHVAGHRLRDTRWLQRNVLECMALFLATGSDRTALHASALVRNGHCLLLAGPSGSGKSTLGYALFRTGFRILAEEAVYVSEQPTARLYGNPTCFHLSPDCTTQFPELKLARSELQPNGKQKIRIDLAMQSLHSRRDFDFSGSIVICFLNRPGEGSCVLRKMELEEMMERLLADREPGFDLSDDYSGVVRRLRVKGAYQLDNHGSVEESVDLLNSELTMLERIPDVT